MEQNIQPNVIILDPDYSSEKENKIEKENTPLTPPEPEADDKTYEELKRVCMRFQIGKSMVQYYKLIILYMHLDCNLYFSDNKQNINAKPYFDTINKKFVDQPADFTVDKDGLNLWLLTVAIVVANNIVMKNSAELDIKNTINALKINMKDVFKWKGKIEEFVRSTDKKYGSKHPYITFNAAKLAQNSALLEDETTGFSFIDLSNLEGSQRFYPINMPKNPNKKDDKRYIDIIKNKIQQAIHNSLEVFRKELQNNGENSENTLITRTTTQISHNGIFGANANAANAAKKRKVTPAQSIEDSASVSAKIQSAMKVISFIKSLLLNSLSEDEFEKEIKVFKKLGELETDMTMHLFNKSKSDCVPILQKAHEQIRVLFDTCECFRSYNFEDYSRYFMCDRTSSTDLRME